MRPSDQQAALDRERPQGAETPVCDKLLELGRRDVVSFHALPLSNLRSLQSSGLRGKYESIFGTAVLKHDLTYTGDWFDTPVLPKLCVERSRQITARAFGANYSCYVTSGTTTSNWIAIFALAGENERVLADRLCHQSIHLALLKNKAPLTYGRVRRRDEASGRAALDVGAFLAEYRAAYQSGRPYKLVVLNGCSYEGVMYDVRKILGACVRAHDEVAFLVDEAWFAFAYFHPLYRPYTAMSAAQEVAREQPGKKFAVVATQSAHKSLSSLRQGSYLHVHGDEGLIGRVKEAQYKFHTTSPSYPILASLELARAQAVAEGHDRVENALRLAHLLREELRNDPALAGYRVNESHELLDDYTRVDPLRVSVDVRELTDDVKAVKDFLFANHGVCISHVAGTALLANIHLGIDEASVRRLLRGLRHFARAAAERGGPRSACAA
jgi:arginine/lysine/ornithine decarboxylase